MYNFYLYIYINLKICLSVCLSVCMYTQFRANYKSAKADFSHVGSQIHGECRDGARFWKFGFGEKQ